jgi:hypothetical protein
VDRASSMLFWIPAPVTLTQHIKIIVMSVYGSAIFTAFLGITSTAIPGITEGLVRIQSDHNGLFACGGVSV